MFDLHELKKHEPPVWIVLIQWDRGNPVPTTFRRRIRALSVTYENGLAVAGTESLANMVAFLARDMGAVNVALATVAQSELVDVDDEPDPAAPFNQWIDAVTVERLAHEHGFVDGAKWPNLVADIPIASCWVRDEFPRFVGTVNDDTVDALRALGWRMDSDADEYGIDREWKSRRVAVEMAIAVVLEKRGVGFHVDVVGRVVEHSEVKS